jgi:hypothetical protein
MQVQDEQPDIVSRLDRIDVRISEIHDLLLRQRQVKNWYTTAEVGQILGMTGYTVREWARHGRINASKRHCGRGRSKEWTISHDELTRIRNEGLLPLTRQFQNGAS